ncbi:MAG TPA: DUF6174 domain-containing protein [Anaerolineales bacterium]|nr:DUF6174 domain-containing protein [Anaerolineales bacterium]
MKRLILLFLVLTLTACSSGGGTELSRNQQKWQDANIPNYRFTLNVGCFCAFRSQMPATVEVQDGEVVSIVGADGETISTTDPLNEYVLEYATIDRLFAELNSDSVQGADKLTVTYDPTYGFPSEISIDFIERAVDDELTITVSAFEPTP